MYLCKFMYHQNLHSIAIHLMMYLEITLFFHKWIQYLIHSKLFILHAYEACKFEDENFQKFKDGLKVKNFLNAFTIF